MELCPDGELSDYILELLVLEDEAAEKDLGLHIT